MEKRVVTHREEVRTNTEQTEKRPRRSFFGIVQFILVTIILAGLSYIILASSLLRVEDIEVEGNQTVESASLVSQARSVMTSSGLSQNILFVPTSAIEKQLKQDNVQISDIKVVKVPLKGLKLVVKEQKASLLWQSGNEQAILAASGYAYTGEPNEDLKRSLPIVVDTSNLPIKTGEKIVTEQFIVFVEKIFTSLPDSGVEVEKIQVGESTAELEVVTKSGYTIRFDTTRPLQEQLTDLKAVQDSLKKQGKKIAEYIDLRINSRVFYK